MTATAATDSGLLETFRRTCAGAPRQADGTIVIWHAGRTGGFDLSVDMLQTGDWRGVCHQPAIGKAVVVSGYARPEEAAEAAFLHLWTGLGA